MVIGVDQQIKDRLPELKAIIQYMPDPLDVGQREAGVMAWEEFLQVGKVRCRVPPLRLPVETFSVAQTLTVSISWIPKVAFRAVARSHWASSENRLGWAFLSSIMFYYVYCAWLLA